MPSDPRLPPRDPEPDPGNPGYPLPMPNDPDTDVVPETDPPTTPFSI
jgi:hypothetical protein